MLKSEPDYMSQSAIIVFLCNEANEAVKQF